MNPDLVGYESYQKRSQFPFNKEIPIVIPNEMSTDEEQPLALEAVATETCPKQFDMENSRQWIGEFEKKGLTCQYI